MARPAHQPTDETRLQVETLARCGVRQKIICAEIGIGSTATLHKHYHHELNTGNADAHAQIGRAAFEKAVIDRDTTMIIWLTKTRLGWKDTSRVIVAGDQEKPMCVEASARDRLAAKLERLAAARAEPAQET